MQETKLLALDVEGTIITGYDYENELPNNKFPAIIEKGLSDVLKKFSNAGYTIVLATGTSGDNLDYYKSEFEKAGINPFITKYSPENHSDKDSKADKLTKYAQEFNISDKQNVYFFDDAESNVDDAKKAGFDNSYKVSDKNTLLKQLSELSDTLGLKKASQFSSKVNMFSPKTTIRTDNENSPLLDDNTHNTKNDCCSPCTIL